MSFCSATMAHGLATLAFLLLGACSVFESQESEFPDAGPGGPDSMYAGIGRGIPFGEFGLPTTRFSSPYTGAAVPVSRSSVGSVLKSARAGKLRLVLNLAGAGPNYRNADGTFNLQLWKSRIDTYRDVDFSPYVTEGLILAHFLMDEPGASGTWGGQQVSRADIEEMARYSNSIWPTLPTAVRVRPEWLLAGNTTYEHLDIAWAQWAGPRNGASRGVTPEQFRDENVAHAKRLSLGLIFGLNYLHGGDGSSGTRNGSEGWWEMSPVLAAAPYSCAFLSWKHEPAFESRAAIRAALDSIGVVAASRGGTSCLRRDSLPPAPG